MELIVNDTGYNQSENNSKLRMFAKPSKKREFPGKLENNNPLDLLIHLNNLYLSLKDKTSLDFLEYVLVDRKSIIKTKAGEATDL